MTTKKIPNEAPIVDRAAILAGFREKLEDALLERAQRFSATAIINEVVKDIRDMKEALIGAMLGISTRFGDVEMDARNGRRSTIDVELRDRWGAEVQPIIDEEIAAYLGRAKANKNHELRKAIRNELTKSATGYQFRDHIRASGAKVFEELLRVEVEAFRKDMLGSDHGS